MRKLTNEEKKEALTLHFKGNENKYSVIMYKSFLKAATTDELEKKFKLSEKSIGHQYILLVGAGALDTHFNALNTKGRKK